MSRDDVHQGDVNRDDVRCDDVRCDDAARTRPEGVPDLGDVAGHWVPAEELAHLPSLRNQRGQGHVNHDLSSLSWVASPPFSFGYHTGVLHLDGAVPDAQRFLWKPWGVRREHDGDGFELRTDTRMALDEDLLLWRTELVNTGSTERVFTLSQDLYAMVSYSEVGWGWLYDVPWSSGDYHDFFTLERIRQGTRDGEPYLLGTGPRRVRLGRPRVPGIQRDEDGSPMLLEHELPAHVSPDKDYPERASAIGSVRDIRCTAADRPDPVFAHDDLVRLNADSELALDAFTLSADLVLGFVFSSPLPRHDGVILTHGNHPDSLQIGLENGHLWVAIAGEKETAEKSLEPGVWYDIAVTIGIDGVSLLLDDMTVATTRPWQQSPRWTAAVESDTIVCTDLHSGATARYAFEDTPDDLRVDGAGGRATWTVTLAPGETRSVGIVCAYGLDGVDTARRARGAADNVARSMHASEAGFRRIWDAMFIPGNSEFSGHLPAFRSADRQLSTAYYMGALQVLYMRNTAISQEPVFLTGGPRLGPTTTYFWDHAEWSRMYALLEPAGMRAWLLRALGSPYREHFGIDAKNGVPLGNEYSSNDYSLFRLTEHYVCITGDTAFLDEQAGDRSVADHLEALAYGWKEKQQAATGGLLADFGDDPWRLLECVPNYVNVVAGFNAAYVAMTRSLAGLLRYRGRDEDAARADADSASLAEAVLSLYAGDGRWQIRHPDGTDVIGHCLDFGLAASALHDDLSPAQREECVAFVTGHLITGTWLRALSADDPIAGFSDRPDHGAGGAFCAWPGVTAHGLARLGRQDLAVALLRLAPESASGGLWGQAMEILPEGSSPSVRVAERGVSNRDSIGGAATAEAVLSGLFDLEPGFADLAAGRAPKALLDVPGVGTLQHLNMYQPSVMPSGGAEPRLGDDLVLSPSS